MVGFVIRDVVMRKEDGASDEKSSFIGALDAAAMVRWYVRPATLNCISSRHRIFNDMMRRVCGKQIV